MAEMKEVRVLRSVQVSDDGIQHRTLVEGTSDRVPAHLFPGLEAAGLVCEPDKPTPGGEITTIAKPKPSRRKRGEA